jgi:hypothetical protein
LNRERSEVIAGNEKYMNFDNRRKRDTNIMFAVSYEDGRTAYITISPKLLQPGENVARIVARERQERGEIPQGEIASVKRVR